MSDQPAIDFRAQRAALARIIRTQADYEAYVAASATARPCNETQTNVRSDRFGCAVCGLDASSHEY